MTYRLNPHSIRTPIQPNISKNQLPDNTGIAVPDCACSPKKLRIANKEVSDRVLSRLLSKTQRPDNLLREIKELPKKPTPTIPLAQQILYARCQ